MPKTVVRDPRVARRIMDALARVVAQEPREASLRRRVQAGTLKTNFATVGAESGVKRHLFDRPNTPYDEEHLAVVAAMPAKGTVPPLRRQLDDVRLKLAASEARLARSRTYAAQVLIRMQKLDLEIARLKEEIANGAAPVDDGSLIGTGRVTSMPPVRRGGSKTGRGKGSQQARGVGR